MRARVRQRYRRAGVSEQLGHFLLVGVLAEVHRYEGTVDLFLGDGTMALFGGDHARRAVQAAPRGISSRARQGLNTELVVEPSATTSGWDMPMAVTCAKEETGDDRSLQGRQRETRRGRHEQ